jgi:glycosyltransferase involved in cell wall biosynthesis
MHKNNKKNDFMKKKIAYIMGEFPYLTTTFINREIIEVERNGINLILISIRQPEPFEITSEVKRLAQQTNYILPVTWYTFLMANLYLMITQTKDYFSTFFYLLTRPHDNLRLRATTILHFAEGIRATEILRPEGVDHIHAHFADRAAIVALVVSRILKIPYSLTAHANDIYVSPVMLSEKIKNAKFTVTCTAYNKDYLERKIGHPVELIYHGIELTDKHSDSRREKIESRVPLILSVGQLNEKKGFSYLLEACGILKSQGRNIRCEIIGKGPQKNHLTRLIDKLALDKTVNLCGALSNDEVMARYAQADIFVLPCVVASDQGRDGIPNVIIEAMANRLPVISTRHSGIPEVVEHNVNGLLVPPNDSEALAAAIAKLLDKYQLCAQMGEQGRQKVEQHFNIRKNINFFIELLMEI